ncbi:Piso0_000115 [Millerozyma farinosa CBS 7064]|uniref:Piso0_000115 protein n=1 Tax=Pichia sorbitophila (strain ATCC MYA-4447 / BCRC 22081 / CBS 7064 / NBRC 10061 / NRRL Y-12695) TaxID=559304 RepID=G8YUK0_PICSO|nr:Piso0_000115 [Millerozyma farinosa CBS 7064]
MSERCPGHRSLIAAHRGRLCSPHPSSLARCIAQCPAASSPAFIAVPGCPSRHSASTPSSTAGPPLSRALSIALLGLIACSYSPSPAPLSFMSEIVLFPAGFIFVCFLGSV